LLHAKFDVDHRIDEESGQRIPLKSVLSKAFVFFIVALAIYYAGSNVITTFISSYMVFVKGMSQASTSLVFAVGALMGIMSSVMSGYMGNRLGDRNALALVMIGAAIFTLIIPLAPSTLTLAFFFLCFNLFTHSIWPPLTSIVASLSSPGRRGLAYSIMRTTSDMVNVVNQPLAAELFEFTSLWMMFPLSFALTSIGVIVLKISSKYVK
jgi:predicted MFS family arabinose efflux permease